MYWEANLTLTPTLTLTLTLSLTLNKLKATDIFSKGSNKTIVWC